MKFGSSSSGCKPRPAKGEPAQPVASLATDAACSGEFFDVAGDAPEDSQHAWGIDQNVVRVVPVALWPQVDHGLTTLGELLDPLGACEQESRLVVESVGYGPIALGIFWCGPAELPQR